MKYNTSIKPTTHFCIGHFDEKGDYVRDGFLCGGAGWSGSADISIVTCQKCLDMYPEYKRKKMEEYLADAEAERLENKT